MPATLILCNSPEALRPLYGIICQRSGIPMDDLLTRSLFCVGVPAHYGAVSHWILSVEGTPPRGTFVFDTNRYSAKTLLLVQDRVYRIGNKKHYDTIDKFVKTHLEKAEGR